MKGFVAYYENVAEEDKFAALGELVVPAFCIGAGPASEFLGVESFLPSPAAEVADVSDKDLEAIADAFVAQYPGLPPKMVTAHLVDSLACADRIPAGSKVSTEIRPDRATVLDRETQKQYVVWEGEDPSRY